MKNITDLQKKFVQEFAKDLSIEDAAIRAGYKKDFASKKARYLFEDSAILNAINSYIDASAKNLCFSKAFFAKKLCHILDYALKIDELRDKNGSPTGQFKMRDVSAALKSLESLLKLFSIQEKSPSNTKNAPIGNLDFDLI